MFCIKLCHFEKESISSCVKLAQLNFEIIHWIHFEKYNNIFKTIVRIKVFIARQLIIIKIATVQQKFEQNLIIINNIQLNCLSLG
jgi:hypothetical protein